MKFYLASARFKFVLSKLRRIHNGLKYEILYIILFIHYESPALGHQLSHYYVHYRRNYQLCSTCFAKILISFTNPPQAGLRKAEDDIQRQTLTARREVEEAERSTAASTAELAALAVRERSLEASEASQRKVCVVRCQRPPSDGPVCNPHFLSLFFSLPLSFPTQLTHPIPSHRIASHLTQLTSSHGTPTPTPTHTRRASSRVRQPSWRARRGRSKWRSRPSTLLSRRRRRRRRWR